MPPRRFLALAPVLTLALALALAAALVLFAGGKTPTAAQGATVSITDFAFNFSPVRIEAGMSVTWLNNGNVTHTATGATFDTGDIVPGSTARVTFDTPGTYDYVCTFHPEMTGTIVVTEGGEPPPPTAAATEPVFEFEGCAQGYWKNHPERWGPTGFSPNQTVESLFDVPDAFGLDEATLIDALRFGGGPGATGAAKILLRAGVAGILNARHPDVQYGRPDFDVILAVADALGSNDRSRMLSLATAIDHDNNRGCPLS